MRKAIWNASIAAEVPNNAAPICSRTKPVMRDSRVSAETEKAALKRFMQVPRGQVVTGYVPGSDPDGRQAGTECPLN